MKQGEEGRGERSGKPAGARHLPALPHSSCAETVQGGNCSYPDFTDIYKKITETDKDKRRDVQVCLFSATIESWVRKVAKKIIPKEEDKPRKIFLDSDDSSVKINVICLKEYITDKLKIDFYN